MATTAGQKSEVQGLLAMIAALLLFGAFTAPLFILAVQAFLWLREGTWPAFPVDKALGHLGVPKPVTEWGGAQIIIDHVWAWPTAVALPVAAALALFVGGVLLAPLLENDRSR